VVQRVASLGITAAVAALLAARWLPAGALPALGLLALLGALAATWLARSAWLRGRVSRAGVFLAGVGSAWTRMLREHRLGLAAHVFILVARFASAVAASSAMLLSFGVRAPFLEVAGLTAAATLAALIPLSPAGLGVAEGVFVAGLHHEGFSVERILAACVGGRLVTILLLGAFALLYSAMPWKDARPRE